MSSAESGRIGATSVDAGSIIPRGAPASMRVHLGWLESFGRTLVIGALSRVVAGRITLIDGASVVRSPDTADLDGAPACTVRVRDPRFYGAAAFGGSLGVAEAYMDGLWDTDDLSGLVETLTVNYEALRALEGPVTRVTSLANRARYFLQRNTRAGSRRNIAAHYDLSNEFFALFLDPSMTYSCAVFENGATTLEAAQREKLDRACRKLCLTTRDHLLEIGTGWGALAIHAATHYGCRVTTTTISREQHAMAQARVRAAGLSDRITIVMQDYRSLTGTYDKLVSIEMIEAVGAEHLGTFFETCARLVRPEGAMLIQAIVIRDQFFAGAAREMDFLKKHIFPGSCLPSVDAMLTATSRCTDLRLWHLEDIGPHYATTLAAWRGAFMGQLDRVRAMGFDDRFIRMWEYYLGYCEGAFRARHVGDVQMLLAKPMHRGPVPGLRG